MATKKQRTTPTQVELEDQFANVLNGLMPLPLQQWHREERPNGFIRQYTPFPHRRFRMDFAWPTYRLAIEVQGGVFSRGPGHTSVGGILRDMEKANLLVLNGWRCLYYTGKAVGLDTQHDFIAEVLQALEFDVQHRPRQRW